MHRPPVRPSSAQSSRHWIAAALACAAVSASSLPCAAAPVRPGIRLGLTDSPSQFVIGGHLEGGTLAEHIQFFPSGTIGLGDHTTTLQLNADARGILPLEDSAWRLYAGAGFGYAHYAFDGGASTSGAGANFLFGAETPARGHNFLVELRAGTGDLPDLAFLAGVTFR